MAQPTTLPRPFVFVLHSHQPVGNFEHVFDEAYRRSYEPFAKVLAAHSGIKAGLHFTGPLLEWIAREHPRYLEDLAKLVEQGQIEILGGGFYEPILSALPDNDASGQIEMMAMFCQRYFGRRPAGMWLAERVWDPDLPRVLAPCGIKYTLLDDSHFRAAGITDELISGHYMTEKAGHPLAIFPIDKGLRYRIPFSQPHEVLDYLISAPGSGCLTYGDDGEKFGLWPNTYEWVFEKKWLERFCAALEQAEADNRVRMVLPEQYLKERPPIGRVYLPNASYEEMMEWALPVQGFHRLHDLRERFKRSGEYETYGPYLRGGIWQNFLAKYSEANQIHKKMLHVSQRLQTAMEDAMQKSGRETIEGDMGDLLGTAQRDLYKGQCCCAYWHGLFGGLYLNYLRDSLYRALLGSERILDQIQQGKGDWISYEEEDIDLDGRDEVLVSNRILNVYVRPHAGGSVFEIDYKPKAFNVTNVLTRREEGYHDLILKAAKKGQGGHAQASDAPKTIHEMVRMKEEGLERALVYDDVPRASFVDRFFPLEASLELVKSGGGEKDLGDFAGGEYKIEKIGVDEAGDASFQMTLYRSGHVRNGSERRPIAIEKQIRVEIDSGDLKVRYALRNDGDQPVEVSFGTEINVNLLAGNDPSRYVRIGGSETRHPLASEGTTEGVSEVIMADEWQRIRVELDLGAPARLHRYPVETVSNSENGFERTYQGTCLVPTWRLKIEPREKKELSIQLGVVEMG
jgi:4-alpha-glucanotransferase